MEADALFQSVFSLGTLPRSPSFQSFASESLAVVTKRAGFCGDSLSATNTFFKGIHPPAFALRGKRRRFARHASKSSSVLGAGATGSARLGVETASADDGAEVEESGKTGLTGLLAPRRFTGHSLEFALCHAKPQSKQKVFHHTELPLQTIVILS